MLKGIISGEWNLETVFVLNVFFRGFLFLCFLHFCMCMIITREKNWNLEEENEFNEEIKDSFKIET